MSEKSTGWSLHGNRLEKEHFFRSGCLHGTLQMTEDRMIFTTLVMLFITDCHYRNYYEPLVKNTRENN